MARVHESLDFRPIQICPHHSHTFAIGPIELAALLLQPELLGGEGSAGRNDGDHVLAIEIGAEDGAIVLFWIAHVGPVDVPGNGVHHQSIRQSPAFVDDGLQIGTSRVCGQHASRFKIQEEQTPGRGGVIRSCIDRHGSRRAHIRNSP